MPKPPPSNAAGAAARPVDWAAALAENERWLRTTVLARLGERQAVDDVMQEVALAAVAQRAPLSDSAKVAAWLHRLAVRQSLLYRRRSGRHRRLLDRFWERTEDEQFRPPEPLDWLLSEERDDQVRTALRRLTSRDAFILMLKYSEDLSYRELAERLGISAAAVEARLHRARQRLREALAATGVIEVRE
jgi:RNA polymerase sigma-70 factor (ECF subfamily)